LTKRKCPYIFYGKSRFRGGKITTIKDIARRAGVSIGTVDRVLHKRGRVSPATEEKVKRIIEERGYRPNMFAKNLKLGRTFTFGVLMPLPSQDSGYWSLPLRGINRAMEDLAGHKIELKYFFYDKYSQGTFPVVAEEVLNSSLDGLLIAPVLSRVFDKFVQEIPPSIPYIFFDSFIPEANYLAYIGQDSFQSGLLSGKLMNLLIPPCSSVAVIKVMPEDYHIEERVNGFLVYFRNFPCVPVFVYEMHGNIEKEGCDRLIRKILAEHPDLKGIFVTNASTHKIAEAVRGLNLDPGQRIRIVGYDVIENNVRLLKEGVIDFLISQQSERQGYEGIINLYRHVVLQEPVEKKIIMQLDIVTRENIDYYRS